MWPVSGRADPPAKTLSHVSRVLAVHRQYHLHHLYLALTMPNLLMNLDPMLTSCAVKEHDPFDYILLPPPKMSPFMIGVTAWLNNQVGGMAASCCEGRLRHGAEELGVSRVPERWWK